MRLVAPIAVIVLALAPASALAAPTMSHPGSTLTVVGDSSAETFTVTAASNGTTYSVQANVPLDDPDGPGADCSASGNTATCTSATTGVSVNGGEGADTFTVNDNRSCCFSSSSFAIDGGGGSDTINAGSSGLTTSMMGGAGDDILNGSNQRRDSFRQEPGADTYNGGTHTPTPAEAAEVAGLPADQVQYVLAEDSFQAGDVGVNISLDGQPNDGTPDEHDNVAADIEEVEGGSGNDVLSAGPNAVEFDGEDGDDTLNGSPFLDYLYGSAGSDTLRGNDGDDELFDGDRSPALLDVSDTPPTPGNDKLDGGNGDDKLSVDAGSDDVSGGPGVDNVYVARYHTQVADTTAPGFVSPAPQYEGMTVSLDDVANDGAGGGAEHDNVHSDVENIDAAGLQGVFALGFAYGTATNADDTITGSALSNRIDTGGGNDHIDGGPGADVINAGTGNDVIGAQDGFTDVIGCDAGADAVTADLAGQNAPRADVLNNCETVTGTPLGPPQVVAQTPAPKAAAVTLGGATTIKTKTFLKSFTLPASVSCDQACSVSGEIATNRAKVATVGELGIGSGTLKSGTGRRTLKAKVAKKYQSGLRRKLRTKRQRKTGIKLTLRITATNASSQVTRKTRVFKIKG